MNKSIRFQSICWLMQAVLSVVYTDMQIWHTSSCEISHQTLSNCQVRSTKFLRQSEMPAHQVSNGERCGNLTGYRNIQEAWRQSNAVCGWEITSWIIILGCHERKRTTMGSRLSIYHHAEGCHRWQPEILQSNEMAHLTITHGCVLDDNQMSILLLSWTPPDTSSLVIKTLFKTKLIAENRTLGQTNMASMECYYKCICSGTSLEMHLLAHIIKQYLVQRTLKSHPILWLIYQQSLQSLVSWLHFGSLIVKN